MVKDEDLQKLKKEIEEREEAKKERERIEEQINKLHEKYPKLYSRTFMFKPKVDVGDKIFFVEDGLIKGYGLVQKVYKSEGGEECQETHRVWGKKSYWVLEFSFWKWLRNYVQMKGFQGIRYLDKLPEIKEKIEVQK